ncbi:MAG: hypothetical protein M5U01_39410 [Ardenticatenaceae bacterium]|nr:hypothetical protein [Ardenticatenaceae bacterium]
MAERDRALPDDRAVWDVDLRRALPPPDLTRFVTRGAGLVQYADGLHLLVARADGHAYCDAQLDDFHGRPHEAYRWRPPLLLEVRARLTRPQGEFCGTAGFGFWNAPFVTERASLLAVRPPAVLWFFLASPPSQLAFAPRPGWQGQGWFAQAVNLVGPIGGPLGLLPAGLLAVVNYVRPLRRLAMRFAPALTARVAETALAVDPTGWHTYRLEWHPDVARFWVDDELVLGAPAPPGGPLAFVAWNDNQWAALGPPVGYRGGIMSVPGEQTLILAHLRLVPMNAG